MPRTLRRSAGFTLIELMVTVAVIIVLAALAYPSFEATRQRAAVRAAAEQTLGFWNQARLEAAKRNAFVKVSTGTGSQGFCLGADLATASDDHTACNCFEENPATQPDFCDVARYPASQGEWKQVTLLSTSTYGTINSAVSEPKRTSIFDATDVGNISLNGPPGRKSYRLNVHIDQFGRGVVCQSNASGMSDLSDFGNRKCAD
jgi:prepilin-type N-terminal cleavage/methylation domain-containing protein